MGIVRRALAVSMQAFSTQKHAAQLKNISTARQTVFFQTPTESVVKSRRDGKKDRLKQKIPHSAVNGRIALLSST